MKSDKIRHDITQFYDTVAPQFSQTRGYWWQGFQFIKKYLKGEERILDFGCGNGRLVEYLKTECPGKYDYVGTDISSHLVVLAQQQHPEHRFVALTDERTLPFGDASFDLIFSIAVYHHFTPEMMIESLRELKRVLRPGGTIIISVWYLWNKKYLPLLVQEVCRGSFSLSASVPFSYTDTQGKQTRMRSCYWWTKSRLERLATRAGFRVVESGYTFDKKMKKRNIYIVIKK